MNTSNSRSTATHKGINGQTAFAVYVQSLMIALQADPTSRCRIAEASIKGAVGVVPACTRASAPFLCTLYSTPEHDILAPKTERCRGLRVCGLSLRQRFSFPIGVRFLGILVDRVECGTKSPHNSIDRSSR